MEPLEKLESYVLMKLKALHEGAWKKGNFIAFSQYLVRQVMLELCAFLKVALKAYSEFQAMLIDVQKYKPSLIVGGIPAMT